ncbi:MAG: 16S rRNA (guanine(527)-N(7))-methyltransferase RsmG [Azoarcus sp.]|jgi:16S rRNA (guanine527-N7)-methyltransferase|nr:16S rRNA (guanine(527)-N(7))-methyltransferase RsmG [Azoarcus sp.]
MSVLAPHARSLADGIAALGIASAPGLHARLLAFGELLLKWNRVYNLTAISDPAEIVTHHLLDSLAVQPLIAGLRTLVDVGSGAGLPGIPLALACPGLAIHSVEAVGKKASFQQQAKIELRLDNFNILNRRVEAIKPADLPAGGVEGVISRAFSSLADFVRLAGPLAKTDGVLYAMKGARPDDEIRALPPGWRIADVRVLTVPGLGAERHVLSIRRG